jgi:hypothetical protein
MHDVTQASFVGCTGVRPTFTWDKVTDSLARHALELQSGESGVLRSAGRLVLSNHSGANDYDPSAAVKLEPLVDGELAHDALSSESATEGAFSYRAHWAKNLFGQPREIARVGVRQGAPSPVSPGATWRALLTAEHSERLEVKLEATGGGDFVVYNGDIEVTGGGNGLICTSPDGFVRKRIALSDDGEIIVTDP